MKKAFVCFACILLAGITLALIVSVFNTSNFWVSQACAIGLYLGYLTVYLVFNANAPTVEKSDFKRPRPTNIVKIMVLTICCIGAFMLLQFVCIDFFRLIGLGTDSSTFYIDTWPKYLMCTLAMCVMPAVIEELLFRGIIFKSLKSDSAIKKPWVALVSGAILFAAFHLSFTQLVYQFILGLIFAGVFMKTGNLLYSMVAHFINNFFIITYTFIAGSDDMSYTWSGYTIITAILLIGVGALIIHSLIKSLKKEHNAHSQR